MQPVFLHVDIDAFFASVEQLDHPEWRGKPVIVGGIPGDRRAVVSTASYEARTYGVHSAMPLSQAVERCPKGIYVRPRMNRYHEKSEQVMAVLRRYSPDVRQMSVDEAFIDITGTERLFGAPEEVAKKIKAEVRDETELTVSVGIASTMYLAKIASGWKKPDGLTVISPGTEEAFILRLPLEKLWGVGTKTLSRLNRMGLLTTRDVYAHTLDSLEALFGHGTGQFLYSAVRGNRDMVFGREPKSHSLSAETTFDFDLTDRYAIETALLELSSHVMFRMHRERVRSRTVALKIRYEDFTTVSVQETSERAVNTQADFFERCRRLFKKKYEAGRGIRLLGVACEHVEPLDVPVQGQLFDFGESKQAKVEAAIYALQDRHPEIQIKKARVLKPRNE